MGNQKLQQNTFISLFKKVISEERKLALKHEIDLLNVRIIPNKTNLKLEEKWLVSRPQKYVAKLVSSQEIKKETSEELEGQHGKIGHLQKKKKGLEYTSQFLSDHWPPIMVVVKIYSNNS